MKQILFILSVLISFSAFSQVKVGSNGDIVPLGNYPAMRLGNYQTGSFPVQTIAQRNAIVNRVAGMTSYVIDSAKTYRLGTDTTTWTEVVSGGSLNTTLGIGNTSNTSVIAPLVDKGGAVYNATAYNVFANGNDMTAAATSMVSSVIALGGGTIVFPAGTFRFNSPIVIPYTGTLPIKQVSLKIIGAGATADASEYGATSAANGGTILDIRYVGDSSHPFLDTRGEGQLEITGINFVAGADIGNTPFIKTTGTTLKIYKNSFYGFNPSTTANQDAIILGGVDGTAEGGGTVEAAFQGYGTVIDHNFFNRIRRAVYAKTYANHIIINGNTIWNYSGGLDAAIVIDASFGNTSNDVGNVITNNLIEIGGYKYGIKIKKSIQNTITGNSFYDNGVNTIAGIFLQQGATYNTITEGFYNGSMAGILDSSGGNNLILRSGANTTSQIPKISTSAIRVNSNIGVMVNDGTDSFYMSKISSGKVKLDYDGTGIIFDYTASPLVKLNYGGDGQIVTPAGTLEIITQAGKEFWMGSPGARNYYLLNGVFNAKGTTAFKMQNAGQLEWSGTSLPGGGTDVMLVRDSAGRLAVNTATAGTAGDIRIRNLSTTTGIKIGGGAVLNTSALFDIEGTKGVLLPRMTATQKNAISSPATGLLLYQTDSTGGFYVRTSTGLWKRLVEERVTAPTVTLGSNITGSVALSAVSTDSKGTVTVTVTGISTLATLNELFTLTFSSAFASAPTVVYSNASSQAAALQFGATGLYVKNAGTTSFQIATNGSYTTPASATYSFTYQIQ